jgi:hypothetical protein
VIRQKKFAILDWGIVLVLSACAVAASEAIGLKQVWEDGAVYTVVLFASVVTALRPAWRRASFWNSLALIFVGHLILLVAVLGALPPRRGGIPKLLLIPLALIEGILIVGLLWKRMKALRTSEPRS